MIATTTTATIFSPLLTYLTNLLMLSCLSIQISPAPNSLSNCLQVLSRCHGNDIEIIEDVCEIEGACVNRQHDLHNMANIFSLFEFSLSRRPWKDLSYLAFYISKHRDILKKNVCKLRFPIVLHNVFDHDSI